MGKDWCLPSDPENWEQRFAPVGGLPRLKAALQMAGQPGTFRCVLGSSSGCGRRMQPTKEQAAVEGWRGGALCTRTVRFCSQ